MSTAPLAAASELIRETRSRTHRLESAVTDFVTTAAAALADAGEAVLLDPSGPNLEKFTAAYTRSQGVAALVTLVEEEGGAAHIADRQLDRTTFFSHVKAAAAASIAALEVKLPEARERLGAERARFTRAGLNMAVIESAGMVPTYRSFVGQIEAVLASTRAVSDYAASRGANRAPRPLEELVAVLKAPLPAAPWIESN